MKTCSALLLCCLFIVAPAVPSLGTGALHTFAIPDGRSLKATILDFNASNKKIRIEREDGRKIWVLPTVFSKPDQEYVRQWIAVDQFMSPAKFRIKGKKIKDRISKEKSKVAYEITLENKTDFPLGELRIEYRAFVLKKILNKDYGGQKDFSRVDGGQFVANIPAGKKFAKVTRPAILTAKFKHMTEGNTYIGIDNYDLKVSMEELEGFWVKVYGPEIDGKPAIREWCNPPDTSENFSWQEITPAPKVVALPNGSRQPRRPRDTHNYSKEEQRLLDKARRVWTSDPEKAIAIAQRCYEVAQAPKAAWMIGKIYLGFLKPADVPRAIEWLKKAADGNRYEACWLLARIYSTYPDPQYHNAKEGIKYGLKAVSINSRDYLGHDKLAEAYALDGQFDKAVEQAEIALQIYSKNGPENGIAIMKDGLERYRNHQVCPPY